MCHQDKKKITTLEEPTVHIPIFAPGMNPAVGSKMPPLPGSNPKEPIVLVTGAAKTQDASETSGTEKTDDSDKENSSDSSVSLGRKVRFGGQLVDTCQV